MRILLAASDPDPSPHPRADIGPTAAAAQAGPERSGVERTAKKIPGAEEGSKGFERRATAKTAWRRHQSLSSPPRSKCVRAAGRPAGQLQLAGHPRSSYLRKYFSSSPSSRLTSTGLPTDGWMAAATGNCVELSF